MSGVFNIRGSTTSFKEGLVPSASLQAWDGNLEYGATTVPQPLFERPPSKADLENADWQLAEAEIEVNRLRQRVRELAQDGYDTSLPATALHRLEGKLHAQRAHRDSLAAELERRPRIPKPLHCR